MEYAFARDTVRDICRHFDTIQTHGLLSGMNIPILYSWIWWNGNSTVTAQDGRLGSTKFSYETIPLETEDLWSAWLRLEEW